MAAVRWCVACLRIVDLRPGVDPLDGTVSRDRWGVGLPPADAAALEHALRLAEAWDGRVVAVCVGPPSVEPRAARGGRPRCLRRPGARPRDEGDAHRYVAELADDERALARTLLAAVGPFGRPDLVLCGDRSVDRGTGALPAYLAHELDAAQALGLVDVDGRRPGRAVGRAPARRRMARTPPGAAARRVLRRGGRRPPAPGVARRGPGRRRRAHPRRPRRSRRPRPRAGGAGPLHLGPDPPVSPRTRVVPPPEGDDPRLRLLALTGALVAHDPPTVVAPGRCRRGGRRPARLPGPPRLPRPRRPDGPRTPGPVTRLADADLARRRRPGRRRVPSSSSPSVRPSSTGPISRSPPTPTSPWPSSRRRPTRDPLAGRGAPPWPTARAASTTGFAGTLSIGQEATESLLVELVPLGRPHVRPRGAGLHPRRQRRAAGPRPRPAGRPRADRSRAGGRAGRATCTPAGPRRR